MLTKNRRGAELTTLVRQIRLTHVQLSEQMAELCAMAECSSITSASHKGRVSSGPLKDALAPSIELRHNACSLSYASTPDCSARLNEETDTHLDAAIERCSAVLSGAMRSPVPMQTSEPCSAQRLSCRPRSGRRHGGMEGMDLIRYRDDDDLLALAASHMLRVNCMLWARKADWARKSRRRSVLYLQRTLLRRWKLWRARHASADGAAYAAVVRQHRDEADYRMSLLESILGRPAPCADVLSAAAAAKPVVQLAMRCVATGCTARFALRLAWTLFRRKLVLERRKLLQPAVRAAFFVWYSRYGDSVRHGLVSLLNRGHARVNRHASSEESPAWSVFCAARETLLRLRAQRRVRMLRYGLHRLVLQWHRRRWRGRWGRWRASLLGPGRVQAYERLKSMGEAGMQVLQWLGTLTRALGEWRRRSVEQGLLVPQRGAECRGRRHALQAAHEASGCALREWIHVCSSGPAQAMLQLATGVCGRGCRHNLVPLASSRAYTAEAACRQLAAAFVSCTSSVQCDVEPCVDGSLQCKSHRLRARVGYHVYLLMWQHRAQQCGAAEIDDEGVLLTWTQTLRDAVKRSHAIPPVLPAAEAHALMRRCARTTPTVSGAPRQNQVQGDRLRPGCAISATARAGVR
mmetsp:Transcript_48328/g.111868  ORF Transcript_48328/g.111868 Transcript_48328/m.111868 type:complete len:633 (-) Transcript_48328:136-2034(-)